MKYTLLTILCFVIFSLQSTNAQTDINEILINIEEQTQGNPDSALFKLNNVRKENIKKDSVEEARYLFLFSNILYYQGNYDSAYTIINHSLRLYKTFKNKKGLIKAYSLKGMILETAGKFEQALEYLSKAEKIAIEINDSNSLAAIYNINGVINYSKGEYIVALENYFEALSVAIPVKNYKIESYCYVNIGSIYHRFKKFREAEEYYKKSIGLSRKISSKLNEADAFVNLGSMYTDQKEYDKALRSEYTALAIYRNINNKIGMAYSYNSLGYIYELMDSLSLAIKYYSKCIDITKNLDTYSIHSTALLNIGATYSKQNEIQKALYYMERSLEIANKIDEINVISDASDELSKIYFSKGRYEDAYNLLIKHKSLSDSLVNTKKLEDIARLKMKYEFDKEQKKAEFEAQKRDMAFKAEMEEYRFYRNLAIGITCLVLIIAVILIYIFRLKQKEREYKMQEELSLYMQKTLSQQMNPHFIFNVLNTIQSYIFLNNKDASMDYISKFAELMKLTLYNSQHNTILIKHELEALNLYVELEKFKLKHGIDYIVTIDDKINTNTFHIPSFILQPLVENSIKHGISHRTKSKGKIEIGISAEENIMRCFVEDNGVGREFSMRNQNSDHKSVATDLTKRRIRLLSQYYKCNLNIRYIDLTDEKGNAKGTRVELELPVIKEEI